MAPFGILKPVFDDDKLPSNITRIYQHPLVAAKIEDSDDDDGFGSDEATVNDGEESEEDYQPEAQVKRAKSNAPTIKRAESIAPLSVNPQYGEVIPTPRQQGAQARRKPVLVDMDSEDEMIWNMKNVGYKDEPVAAELVKLGKIHYDPKTIATRYSRIKKTQHAYEEQILDEDFSDYHEQEDAYLEDCLNEVEASYKIDLERVEQKRFNRVADAMNNRLQRKKYTGTNAQARVAALKNGTAIPPVEQDPEAHIRKARRALEIASCRTARNDNRYRERREKEENKQREEREAAELAEKRMKQEQDRRVARLAKEKRQAEAAATREARLQIKQEEEQTRAERAAMRVIETERKKKSDEEKKAGKRWEREQDKLRRQSAKEEEALAKIESRAEKAKAKILNAKEEQQRRELIRRHMRAAGILTAAPIEPAKKRIERKAGVYKGNAVNEGDDRKPDKAALDNEVDKQSTWSPWSVKGRAANRKSGKRAKTFLSAETIED